MDIDEVALQPGDALIVVDVQNDFLPGGSPAVAYGDRVVGPLNEAAAAFSARGGPWPPHCVQGADFGDDLRLPPGTDVISKSDSADTDAYSGFEGTDLHEWLARLGVTSVLVGGLATDYYVLNTVLDARRLGHDVVLLSEAIAAVDVSPADGEAAVAQRASAGAVLA